jgi:disulfide bond formation protein DsbB
MLKYTLTQQSWATAMVALSALALVAALAMQYLGGLAPCNLCVYQRYAYLAVVVVSGALLLAGYPRAALVSALILMLVEAGLAYYHWGVELGWFELPQSCTGVAVTDDFEAFKRSVLAEKVQCDDVAGQFIGLSIAAWNAMFASALAIVSIYAAVFCEPQRVAYEN